MKESEKDLFDYIFDYCGDRKTDNEKKALNHYLAVQKCDPSIEKNKTKLKFFEKMYSKDPEVHKLLEGGFEEFKNNVCTRIWNKYGNSLELNRCPSCGGVARTPQAKQCRYCKLDWH